MRYFIIFIFSIWLSIGWAEENSEAINTTSFDPADLPSSAVCSSPAQNVPVIEYLKIWQGALPQAWYYFRLENALYKLKFYPEMPSGKPNKTLTEAIKAFQKSIKSDPTGELLVCEWVELVKRVNEVFPRNVYPSQIFPVPLNVKLNENYIKAEGTWQLQDARNDFPFLQTSDIRCYRDAKTCVEANAMIISESDVDAGLDRNYLTVEPIIWKIQNWGDDEVAATNSEYSCLRASLYINLTNKKIYKLYRFYPGPACGRFANKKPHIFDFVDGETYAKGFYKSQHEKIGSFYNPEYLRRVQKLSSSPNDSK